MDRRLGSGGDAADAILPIQCLTKLSETEMMTANMPLEKSKIRAPIRR